MNFTPPSAKERSKALDLALQQIEKQFGKGAIMKLGEGNPAPDIETISTGSIGLDMALLRSLTMEETLPPGLSLVPGSVSPAPAEIVTGALQTTLKWQFNFPARQETVAYSVKPSSITSYVLATTKVEFRDSEDRMGSLVVPTKPLTVTGPCFVPTNTPTPTDTPTPTFTPTPTNTPTNTPTVGPTDTPTFTPTPTNTPTPTFTPTPTLTATPVPTATDQPRPLYLPMTADEHCVPKRSYVDVALVLDMSTTMRDPAPISTYRPSCDVRTTAPS